MVYRSEVVLALSSKGVSALKARWEAMDKDSYVRKETEALLSSADKHYMNVDSGAEVFYWESVKWNHRLEETQFVMDCIKDMDKNDYRFIRIGEDTGDIERQGCFDEPFEYDSTRRIDMRKSVLFARPTPCPLFPRQGCPFGARMPE